MRNIKTLISSSAILPSLVITSFVNVQASIAAPPVPGVMVLAQGATTQTEEELRRKREEEKHLHQPGTAPAGNPPPQHQNPPPAPVEHKVTPPPQPPVQVHPAPVAPTPKEPVHTPPPVEQNHVVVPNKPVVQPPPSPPAVVQPKPQVNAPVHVEPVQPAKPAVPLVTPTPANPPKPPAVVAPAPVTPHAVVPVQPPAPGVANPAPTHVVPAPGTPVNPPPAPGTPHTPPVVQQPQQQQPQTQQPVAPVNPQFKPVNPQAQQPGIQPRPIAPAANGPSTIAPQFPQQQPQQAQQPGQPKKNGITPLEGVAIGAAVGVVGGMIIGQQVHGLNEVQSNRREIEQNGATFYSEPGRVIVREGDGLYVRHDETERFREFGGGQVRVEQHGDQTVQIVRRPDGSEIITITDINGQLLKRVRRQPNGGEVVIIDNSFRPLPRHFSDEIVTIAPPPMTEPADQYYVDADRVDEGRIYETLEAPPLASLPRRYTLDEVRYSRDLRQYMRSVDLTTVTFSTGSWAIEDSEVGNLQAMADAINKAVRANPNEVFLVEGHTDAVGSDVDNLSLSDRRAQSVAAVLTKNFNVPPENLTTQGYGAQFLKIQTSGAERANRRVTIRRITPLLTGSNGR